MLRSGDHYQVVLLCWKCVVILHVNSTHYYNKNYYYNVSKDSHKVFFTTCTTVVHGSVNDDDPELWSWKPKISGAMFTDRKSKQH